MVTFGIIQTIVRTRIELRLILTQLCACAMLTACFGANPDPLKKLEIGAFAAPPDILTLKIENYRPRSGHSFKEIFVSNNSAVVSLGKMSLSTARDGMSDELKTQLSVNYNFQIFTPESAVVGFADLLLIKAGIQVEQQSLLFCASNLMNNTSGDAFVYNDARQLGSPTTFLGLRDCAKTYMGLNPALFDNDGDGIPDYLELRCGLNPANKSDAILSTAADGISNLEKCKFHIPVAETASPQTNKLFAYNYSQSINGDGSRNFEISNIGLVERGKDNFLMIYIIEKNDVTGKPALSSGFAILKEGYSSKTLRVDYWGVDAQHLLNQEVAVP